MQTYILRYVVQHTTKRSGSIRLVSPLPLRAIAWPTLGINEIGWQPTTSTRQNKSFICAGDCAVCVRTQRDAPATIPLLYLYIRFVCCQTTYGCCSQLCKKRTWPNPHVLHTHTPTQRPTIFLCAPFFDDCPMHGAFYTRLNECIQLQQHK